MYSVMSSGRSPRDRMTSCIWARSAGGHIFFVTPSLKVPQPSLIDQASNLPMENL